MPGRCQPSTLFCRRRCFTQEVANDANEGQETWEKILAKAQWFHAPLKRTDPSAEPKNLDGAMEILDRAKMLQDEVCAQCCDVCSSVVFLPSKHDTCGRFVRCSAGQLSSAARLLKLPQGFQYADLIFGIKLRVAFTE